jgi:hypothetical protein
VNQFVTVARSSTTTAVPITVSDRKHTIVGNFPIHFNLPSPGTSSDSSTDQQTFKILSKFSPNTSAGPTILTQFTPSYQLQQLWASPFLSTGNSNTTTPRFTNRRRHSFITSFPESTVSPVNCQVLTFSQVAEQVVSPTDLSPPLSITCVPKGYIIMDLEEDSFGEFVDTDVEDSTLDTSFNAEKENVPSEVLVDVDALNLCDLAQSIYEEPLDGNMSEKE